MYMTSTKLNNKKAAKYVSQSIPLGVNFSIVYMPSLMFQICTDADHVNAKGLLKRGTGNTGKKHEERESKKGNKTDNWK